MNNAWKLLLALTLATPAYAQEEPAAEDETYEEVPAEEAPAEEVPAEEVPAEDASAEEVPAEDPVAEEATADESIETTPVGEESGEELDTVAVDEGEEAPAEETDPLRLYAGLDFARTTLSASTLNGFRTGEYDSGMYRLRIGTRLIDEISAELHYGFDQSGDGAGNAATENYVGLFVVPTASLFNYVELAFPLGYALTSVELENGASDDLGSIAYGVNAELPLKNFGEDLPDFRFGLGWMVYYQKTDARLYGANLGFRYDFDLGDYEIWNPFAGLDLWPFGDDEDAEVAEEE